MADNIGNKAAKNYYEDIPFVKQDFIVKGMDNVDWGMKNRLSKIFNPKDGRTVMLAFDHGYIMGSTAGLERLDVILPDLVEEVDCLMGTRGAFRSCVAPTSNKGIALRCSAGASVLEDDMSHEIIGVDIDDAIRMDASCLAIQTYVGAEGQRETLDNLCKTVNLGNRYGIPTLGVVGVGKDMERTTRFYLLATRMLAELGASIIKTYYCEDFEKVVAACPVPIVVAGGKKLPEDEALTLVYKAIQGGAVGVDMGRNIFQAENPKAMARCISKIVHENLTDVEAYELYKKLKVEL
ncbi:MAG: 3-hydroxy-5-phosphonooxypentane-2,4-dione thiolase [Mycoplasmatota bacterium]